MKWPQVRLGEVCKFLNGGTPSKKVARFYEGDIPLITGADMTEEFVTSARSFITEEAVQSSATNKVLAGTLLLVTRTSVGKVAIAGVDLCFSQDITAVLPKPNTLHTKYLMHFLRSQTAQLRKQQRGATIQGITREVVSNLKIPLPPLAEQERIAAILERADTVRRLRREALARCDELVASVFVHTFGDPGANPMNWPVGKIGDMTNSVNYGTSQKAGETGEFPILRMGNITQSGHWNFSSLKYISFSEKDKDKYLVREGDVLFNRTNSPELVGKTALYRESKPMAFAGYLIRVRVNAAHSPDYLAAFLNSLYGKTILRHMCKSIVGMANINATELREIKVPLPPLELQQKFAGDVERIEAMKARMEVARAHGEALFGALQDRAFRGAL